MGGQTHTDGERGEPTAGSYGRMGGSEWNLWQELGFGVTGKDQPSELQGGPVEERPVGKANQNPPGCSGAKGEGNKNSRTLVECPRGRWEPGDGISEGDTQSLWD